MSLFKGGLSEMMQQATKMRDEFKRVQDEAAKRTIEVTAGAGMIKITINGRQEILSVKLDPQVLSLNDQTLLEDLIKSGVNEAVKVSQQMISEEMKKFTGGLGPLSSFLKDM